MTHEPTICVSREGIVRLASWNSGPIIGGPWNWLQLRFTSEDGKIHLQDYTPLERERKAVAWANRSVASVQEHMWRGEDLLRQTLAAIDTGRSEPLFIMRDAIRNFLDRDSDGSGEADKTHSGLAEGDSAGLKGIAETPSDLSSRDTNNVG